MCFGAVCAHEEEKQDNSWWWDEQWWSEGQLPVPVNHTLRTTWVEYKSNGHNIPAMVVRPDDDKKYPAVLFQHGRRGLDSLIQNHVRRLAARGFVVVAPDVYTGRFIEALPIAHDYTLEEDVNKGLDVLLARDDISSRRACIYSHTRGGYYSLKVAVSQKRQGQDLACYVSYYPHLQDPNAPEPEQVYRYATEVDDLRIPTLIFIGENEQYQRRRSIETAVKSLKDLGRPVQLIIYPGVGRGFDFRPGNVRTLADDLAAQDAVQRAARFIRQHLQ
ncbi:MAG: dienelactone hydrolase family protein [Gammaproteobacteria bacterium]